MPAFPSRPKVEHLSSEQARRLSAWLADWSRVRVDDGNRDHRDVEAAIARIYERTGCSRLRFRWVDSPWATLAAGVRPRDERQNSRPETRLPRTHFLVNYGELNDPRFGSLSERIRNALRRSGSDDRDMQVIRRAHPEGTLLRWPIADGTGAAFESYAPYLACCREVLGVQYNDLASTYLDVRMRTARCFGWWWRDENVCVVSERPTVMHRDDRGLLHHPTGAAVRFRDGFSAYAWHGTTVPEPWITSPETIRPQEALTWPDIEQRRAALEIVGWKRVLETLDPRPVDTDADPAVGQLIEVDLPPSGPARFLRVRCGTGRQFVLPVPRGMRTALEANAWTYGLAPTEYKLEART